MGGALTNACTFIQQKKLFKGQNSPYGPQVIQSNHQTLVALLMLRKSFKWLKIIVFLNYVNVILLSWENWQGSFNTYRDQNTLGLNTEGHKTITSKETYF